MAKLMDVNCVPMRFESGQRLLVKTRVPVDAAERKKIHKMVQCWAGDHVEVLVIGPQLEIQVEQRDIINPTHP
jgi:hypothetical protein